eukprot:746332-Hanusia_phi.AAC.5
MSFEERLDFLEYVSCGPAHQRLTRAKQSDGGESLRHPVAVRGSQRRGRPGEKATRAAESDARP